MSDILQRVAGLGPRRSKRNARTTILSALSMLLFAAYSITLFRLQVVQGSEFRSKAENIAQRVNVLPSQRGEIFDRDGITVLATNSDSFAVSITPAEVPANSRASVFALLASLLDLSITDIDRAIPPSQYRLYRSIEVASSIPYRKVAAIAERIDELPGVSWRSKPIRSYHGPASLSHIIGYVGDISRDEYKILYNENYSPVDIVGKAGIERQYDRLLKGTDGRQYTTIDAQGKNIPTGNARVEPPVQGTNLVLTIDSKIQEIAEKALGNRMGSAVVLRPSTGEILAMVSYPWYDSTAFSGTRARTEYAKLLADPNTPLINRAVQSSYPPASTFKAVLTAAIYEEKAYSPGAKIVCRGEIAYGDRVFRCWIRVPGHGPVDLHQALAQSCDVYYWTVGRDNLGVEKIVAYSNEFGFGSLTGIDLPGEVAGLVPTPQWKERRIGEKWTAGDTMNLSIGQGYMLATPLQVANMVAMVVNGGTIYRPHLVREMRDPATGAIVKIVDPEILAESGLSSDTFRKTGADLRGVIVEGTARVPVNTRAVKVAGKTGTAEVGFKDRWHSWFVAYGPYDAKPEEAIVVVVMVEATNPWEWWAPYASNIIFQSVFARQDFEQALTALGVKPGTNIRGRVE